MSEVFDRLAKMAAGGVSCRQVLKGLGGVLAGGFLTAFGGAAQARDKGGKGGKDDGDDGDGDDRNEEINEACQKYCKSCRGLKGGVHGKCINQCKKALRKNSKAILCGSCSAAAALTVCSGAASCCTPKGNTPYCANLSTDVNNCKTCGTVCTGTTPACCSSVCVDLDNDANNCGSCGNKCACGQTCSKGACG